MYKALKHTILFTISLLAAPVLGQPPLLNTGNDNLLGSETAFPQPLPAEEAFALTVQQRSDDQLVLSWDIADGYYLYRKSIGLEGIQANLSIPEGTLIEDEYFGEVAIFEQHLEVQVMLEPKQKIDSFTVTYQGCAKDTYCYPKQFLELEI